MLFSEWLNELRIIGLSLRGGCMRGNLQRVETGPNNEVEPKAD